MQENVAYKAHTETIPTAQNAAYNAVQSSQDNDQGYVINQLVYEEPNSPVQSGKHSRAPDSTQIAKLLSLSYLKTFHCDLSFPSPSTEESKIEPKMHENIAYKTHTQSIPTTQNTAYNAVQSSEDNDQGYVINQLMYEEPNSSPVQSGKLTTLELQFPHK